MSLTSRCSCLIGEVYQLKPYSIGLRINLVIERRVVFFLWTGGSFLALGLGMRPLLVPHLFRASSVLPHPQLELEAALLSIVDHFSKGVIALPFVWDVEWLKNVRKRCIIPTDS